LHGAACDYLALERHAVVVYVFEIDTKARLQSGKLSCEDVGAAVNVLCLGYEPNLFIWIDIVLDQDSFKGLKGRPIANQHLVFVELHFLLFSWMQRFLRQLRVGFHRLQTQVIA